MENENIICKADIRPTVNKRFMIVWYTISTIVFIIGSVIPTISSLNNNYADRYYLFFMKFLLVDIDIYHTSYWYFSDLLIALLITIVVLFPLIVHFTNRHISQICTLELNESGVNGQRKKLLSTKQLKLPIDKVDNVMISVNVWDKLFGGKTVAIRSTSGLIKFPWVQNADEFVNTTLAKIEEYKKSAKKENKNLMSMVTKNTGMVMESSAAAKIKELKELLDSGLISQDEFESKRKELLEKL